MAYELRSAGAIRGASTRKGGKGAGLGANGVATNSGEERLVVLVNGLGDWHCSSFGFLSMNVVYTLDAVNTGVGFPHLERRGISTYYSVS